MKLIKNSFLYLTLILSLILIYISVSVIPQLDHMISSSNKKLKEVTDENTKLRKLINQSDDKFVLKIKSHSIQKYIEQYKFLSEKSKKEIFQSIIEFSKKYRISPILLLAVIDVESNMKYWIKHSTIVVKNHQGKKVKTNAIGLGGIIWEIWGPKLIQHKVCESKSDLYKIQENIEATALILSNYIYECKSIGNYNQIESGIIRYYGVIFRKKKVDVSYLNKVNDKIAKIVTTHLTQIYCRKDK